MKRLSLLLFFSLIFLQGQVHACTFFDASVSNIQSLGNDQFQITFELCQGDTDGATSLTTGFLLDIQCATIDNLLTPSLTSTNGQTINATINGTTIEWGDVDDPTAPVFIDQNVNGGAQQCFTVDVVVTIDFNCTVADNIITYDFVAAYGAPSGSIYPGNNQQHCWGSFSEILPCESTYSFDLSINQQFFGNWNWQPLGDSLVISDPSGNVLAQYDSQTLFNLGSNDGNLTVNLYPFCFECGNFVINYYVPLNDPQGNIVTPKWIEVDFNGTVVQSDTGHSVTLNFDSGVPCSIVTSTNPTCLGNCDGTIVFDGSLLTQPVDYSIDDMATSQNSNTFTGLCAGTYYVSATDATGYIVLDTVELTASIPVVDLGPDIINCDGTPILLNAGGPFAGYDWQDNSTAQTFNATTSGTYWVTVTDINGCTNSDTIELGINQITANVTNIINESCNNANNASATVQNILGSGNGQYTVTWIDPVGAVFDTEMVNQGGSSSQNTLYSGIWQVIITDDYGCQWNQNIPIQVGSITINALLGHPQCYNTATGSITANTTTPGTFYFEIKDSNGDVKNNNGTNTANSLLYGTYTVSITDDNGCYNELTVELINPPSLDVDINITAPPCYGESKGIAFVERVHNYQGGLDDIIYSWDPTGLQGIGETIILDQPSGEYTVQIQDSIGCTYLESFFIPSPDPLVGILEVVSPTYCRTAGYQKGNGEVAVTTGGIGQSGTGNVIYEWENLTNGDVSNNTTFIVNEPGWMVATLTDDNHCIFRDSIYVDSLNPEAAFILESDDFEGPGKYEGTEMLDVELINQSINFSKSTYALSDSTFSLSWFNNEPGNENNNWFFRYDYNITKTDTVLPGQQDYEVCLVAKNFNDCRDTICEILTVNAFPELEVPNVFTPGASPNNEFFFPSRGIEVFDCRVFNRYGVEVFRFNSIDDKWDGNNMRNGKECRDGVYFYVYKATSTNNTEFDGQGNIHLIRKKE